MIQVKLYKKAGKIIGCSFNGHAGYDEYQKDIVCAGVTAQVMMAYNGLDMVLGIPMELNMDNDGGRLEFKLSEYTEEELEKAQIILESLKIGIKGIEEQYKKNIRLKEEEV